MVNELADYVCGIRALPVGRASALAGVVSVDYACATERLGVRRGCVVVPVRTHVSVFVIMCVRVHAHGHVSSCFYHLSGRHFYQSA